MVGEGADHHTRGACAPQTAAVPSLGEDLGLTTPSGPSPFLIILAGDPEKLLPSASLLARMCISSAMANDRESENGTQIKVERMKRAQAKLVRRLMGEATFFL